MAPVTAHVMMTLLILIFDQGYAIGSEMRLG
jgi:hypothetical protein